MSSGNPDTVEAIRGKRILVLGGSPREIIDGVRHYVNQGRDQSHGARTANALAARGATVTMVTVKSSSGQPLIGVKTVEAVGDRKITSTTDLLAACAQQLSEHYDAVVQLANIASIVSAQPSDRKLKVKGLAGEGVSLEVVGNGDVVKQLRSLFPRSAVVGYSNQQQWLGAGDDDALALCIREVADQQREQPMRPEIAPSAAPVNPDGDLAGRKVIVTSGPTAEPITASGDVITNFSSGRQGHAVAEALAFQGAEVVLVSGPTSVVAPANGRIRMINVSRAREMHDAVISELPADAFVGVAAVADFAMPETLKLGPSEGDGCTLHLTQNPDILRTVGTHTSLRPTVVVGFAAETHAVLDYARGKLKSKGADFICANQVGGSLTDRNSGMNKVSLVTPFGDEELRETSKLEIGEIIGAKIAELLTRKKRKP